VFMGRMQPTPRVDPQELPCSLAKYVLPFFIFWVIQLVTLRLAAHAKLKTKRMAKAARVQTSNFIRLTTSKAGPEKITSQNGDLPEFTYLEGQSSSSKHSVSVEDELEEDVGDDSQDDQPLMLRLAITRAHAAQGQPSSPPNNLSAPLPLVPRLVGLSDVVIMAFIPLLLRFNADERALKHQDTDSHLREVSRTLKSMVSDNGEGGVASQPPVPRINDAEKLSFDQKVSMTVSGKHDPGFDTRHTGFKKAEYSTFAVGFSVHLKKS